MPGTNNSAAPPSYFDKAKDAMHSVVGNLTGHDDKETTSKSYASKASSAGTAVAEGDCEDCETKMKSTKDTEGSTQKTAIKLMKDTDGAIHETTIEEATDMGGACKLRATEASGAIQMAFSDAEKNVEACHIVKGSCSQTSDALKGDEEVESKVVDDATKKIEVDKDAQMPKSLTDSKSMDGASDTKAGKKMDIEENQADKADHKAPTKKMDDKMDHKTDDKMDHKTDHKTDHKADHKEMDSKMMGDGKTQKTPVEKQTAAVHKMDDASENTACAKEGSSCGKVARDMPSHMHKYDVGEACSKNGSADIDIDIDTKGC